MWPDQPYAGDRGSFLRRVPPPLGEVNASPTITVAVSCEWLPYIRGALQQLLLQATWDTANPALLLLTQQRAFNLIDLFQECSEPPAISCPYLFAGAGAGPDGFVTESDAPVFAPPFIGAFLPGSGWIATVEFDAAGGNYRAGIQIRKDFLTPVNMNAISMEYNLTKGVSSYVGGEGTGIIYTPHGGAPVFHTVNPATDPDGIKTTSVSFTATLIDTIRLRVFCGEQNGSDPGGAAQIVEWGYNNPDGGCTGGP